MRKILATLVVLLGTTGAASASTTFDLVGTFSGNNPSGPFTYGYGNAVAGFLPYTSANKMTSLGGYSGIYYAYTTSPLGLPIVGHSNTGFANFYTNTVSNTVLFIQPGPTAGDGGPGYDAIVKFTAPHAGKYTSNVTFSRADTSTMGDGTTAALYSNNLTSTALGVKSLNLVTPTGTFTGSFNLAQGDVLYFDLSANSGYSFDGTALSGSITAATPEPSGLALLGTGVLSVAGFARRRFRRA